MVMENYELTLRGDSIDGYNRTYFVDYKRRDQSGKVLEEFQLEPNLLYDKSFEKIAITNPSTKHYWNKDIFTVIMSLPLEEQSIKEKQAKEDSLKYKIIPLLEGEQLAFKDTLKIREPDTFLVRNYEIGLEAFARTPDHPDYVAEPNDIGVSATVVITRNGADTTYREQIALVLREGLLYHYPAQLNEISTRLKIDESVFDQLLVAEDDLEYQEFVVTPGTSFTVGNKQVTFSNFQPSPQVDHYTPRDGDISVSAQLQVTAANGTTGSLEPVFIIRDKVPSRIRDEHRELGIFANLVNLNPETSEATLLIAESPPRGALKIPVAVATNSARSDWLALQAIEFPGINLFWIGTIAMMGGLLISMVFRIRERRARS
jgi:cytochrome c-type biogenesis protein CcmF